MDMSMLLKQCPWWKIVHLFGNKSGALTQCISDFKVCWPVAALLWPFEKNQHKLYTNNNAVKTSWYHFYVKMYLIDILYHKHNEGKDILGSDEMGLPENAVVGWLVWFKS